MKQQQPVARPPLVYIAGAYRNADPWLCEQNIRVAESWGYRVAQLGAYPVIPHSNTRAYFASAASDELWLAGTLQMMRMSDAVLFLENWQASRGAKAEHAEACRRDMEIFCVAHLQSGQFVDWVSEFTRKQHRR